MDGTCIVRIIVGLELGLCMVHHMLIWGNGLPVLCIDETSLEIAAIPELKKN
jgi:hypothetical protein